MFNSAKTINLYGGLFGQKVYLSDVIGLFEDKGLVNVEKGFFTKYFDVGRLVVQLVVGGHPRAGHNSTNLHDPSYQ